MTENEINKTLLLYRSLCPGKSLKKMSSWIKGDRQSGFNIFYIVPFQDYFCFAIFF